MALMLSSATGTVCAQDRLYADEFPLGDVTLLEGPLKKARDLNINTLLKYDCDRLLAPYLKEAGLTPKGKSYPNWDGLDGHVGGHYLTAMAINAATGDKECQKRMEYFISELQACADANAKNHPEWGKGYVGGVPGSDRIWGNFKKETSALTMVHGYLSIIYIKCMPDCAMPGFIVATNRPNSSSWGSATGLST